MNISLDKARLFQNEFLVLASCNSFKYLVGAGNSHRDLSIHIERPPPPSQVVHGRDNLVEAKIRRFAKS